MCCVRWDTPETSRMAGRQKHVAVIDFIDLDSRIDEYTSNRCRPILTRWHRHYPWLTERHSWSVILHLFSLLPPMCTGAHSVNFRCGYCEYLFIGESNEDNVIKRLFMPWLQLQFDYGTTMIRLRSDYDPTTTYRARLLPIRRKQKMNMSIFRRSRIVVESQILWYRL